MAEDKTKLTPTQKEAVAKWLDDKWTGSPNCPICVSTDWSISDYIVTPTTMSGKTLALGGVSYPQIMVICDNCGHTRYFNIVRIGILSGEKEEEKEAEKKGKDGSK